MSFLQERFIARNWFSIQFGITLVIGIGTGLLSAFYPPLFAMGGVIVFTVLGIILYSNTFSSSASSPDLSPPATMTGVKSTVLFYMCYFSFFLSITVPKSGKTIGSIPVTTANIFFVWTLCFWVLKIIFSRTNLHRIPAFLPVVAFVFYGVVSAMLGLVSGNAEKAILLEFVVFFGFIPIYFLVCTVVQTKEHLTKLTKLIVFSLLLVCSYGILQLVVGSQNVAIPGITEQYGMILYEQFGGRWNKLPGGGEKLYSVFQNGNIFGNHLATFIPFLGGIIMSVRTRSKKFILLGILCLACFTLFLTYSRGALVGTICGILALVVISKKIRFNVIITVLIALGAVSFIFMKYYSDRPEFSRYNVTLIAENPNQFSAGRIERAQQVLAAFQRFTFVEKLFGVGLGGAIITPASWYFQLVDNLYLTLLFKMGIVGIVLLFWMLGSLFLTLFRWRSFSHDLKTQALISGGIAGLTGSLVHNLADTLWYFPPLAANFWFLAGMTICIGGLGAPKKTT